MDERELSIIQAIGEEVREILTGVKSQFERDIGQLIASEVQKAVAALPPPVVPELPDVTPLVADAVQKAFVEIFPPYEPPDVTPLVENAVQKAVAELPAPTPANDGRDALQLEILPCIDEQKSYPRGTYATHNGGLWRTYEKSHGLRGWECIVDGVAGTEIKQIDPRQFSVMITKSSGATQEETFITPVMIYKDVFKTGTTYQPGDTVTWGGSLWHCNESTADKPGEIGSKGWTLAAKRGRDARG
ncbi:phage portal protein [Escherichia albertii]|nr:phage portal protein [Escherichia albertii]